MKLILPQNIFASLFINNFLEADKHEIMYKDSALIAKGLEVNTSAVALMPSLELINNRNLFVSSKAAVVMSGALCNSYIYFNEGAGSINKLYLRGDVTLNEVLFSKLIFSEIYSREVEISLDPGKKPAGHRDFIVIGDENFNLWDAEKGISLAEEIAELTDYPYVNFVFASPDKDALEEFNNVFNTVNDKPGDKELIITGSLDLSGKTKSFLEENLTSLYYDMNDDDVEALREMIKQIYYHGIIEDMFDVKFV
jgi:predicted solute-binding protein